MYSSKRGIGVMSGTSLDGLDFAFCDFENEKSFELLSFSHIPYPENMVNSLKLAPEMSGLELLKAERDYSDFVANELLIFIASLELSPEFIACHGHTIFHQPETHFTYQMLNGNILAAKTQLPCICDFRRLDVALGGQGAPLVPIGDEILFSGYAACLNIGGFANVSMKKSPGNYDAFDICPVNIVMNGLAEKLNMAYDKDGEEARKGEVVPSVMDRLNELPFYNISGPKSLGREWVESEITPMLHSISNTHDALRTWVEHAAIQIGRALSSVSQSGNTLCTGGGCHNKFLVERIQTHTSRDLIIPEPEIIDYKEAIVFALLGKLRLDGRCNVYGNITGSGKDSISGCVYLSPVKN